MCCLLLALQRHYATLQAVALDQDEDNLPEIKDNTLPDVDGIAKYVMLPLNDILSLRKFPLCYSVLHSMRIKKIKCSFFSWRLNWDWQCRADSHAKAFKDAVYGANHDEDEAEAAAAKARGSVATQKRKAAADLAVTEAQEYNWAQLADTGKVHTFVCIQDLNSRVEWFQAFQLS